MNNDSNEVTDVSLEWELNGTCEELVTSYPAARKEFVLIADTIARYNKEGLVLNQLLVQWVDNEMVVDAMFTRRGTGNGSSN